MNCFLPFNLIELIEINASLKAELEEYEGELKQNEFVIYNFIIEFWTLLSEVWESPWVFNGCCFLGHLEVWDPDFNLLKEFRYAWQIFNWTFFYKNSFKIWPNSVKAFLKPKLVDINFKNDIHPTRVLTFYDGLSSKAWQSLESNSFGYAQPKKQSNSLEAMRCSMVCSRMLTCK